MLGSSEHTPAEPIYVTNLLPQLIDSNWVVDRMTVTSWTGTASGPQGNVFVMTTDKSYSEAYIYPKDELFPYLSVGHTYYLRWMSKKEHSTGIGMVSYDVYWPEMENGLVRNADQGQNSTAWKTFSYVLTLNQSQWPNNTVADGNYRFRFDCNNRKYAGTFRFADPLLVDLTDGYTNNGLFIPTKEQLDLKRIFMGVIMQSNGKGQSKIVKQYISYPF